MNRHPQKPPLPFLLVAFLTALLATPLLGQRVSDPDLFNKSAAAALEALLFYEPIDDPEELERVNRIGYEIAQKTGFDKYPFTFHIVEMAVPNAFALPAGHIFITRGMLSLKLNDDMLAGILGHEIAHVTQEHFLKMKKRATLLNVLSQVATIGVMVGASQQDSGAGYYDPVYGYRSGSNTADIVSGVAVGGMVITELLLRSYSRGNEDEADDEGQRFAAASGYDPDGTRQLMDKMERRLPQDQTFGYWQTHPFFEERVLAARARKTVLTIKERESADEYRQETQASLLDFIDSGQSTEETIPMTKDSALMAWPRGTKADAIRLEKLQRLREEQSIKDELARDYGPVLVAYHKDLQTVTELTPESPFLQTVIDEIAEMEAELDEILPKGIEVLDGEVQQVPFLAIYLSNFPDSERAADVALKLGLSYSRLGRETEAVENLLIAWRSAPGSEDAATARRGLKNLTPYLIRLSALHQLVDQGEDEELSRLAEERLARMAPNFEELENGSDYLKRFPDSPYAPAVTVRQDLLAEELYKEVILYQQVGDHGKAVEGINQILTWAPLSAAAAKLSDEAVLSG